MNYQDMLHALKDANIQYTVFDDPKISDQEYDALKHNFLAAHKEIYGTEFKETVSLIGIVEHDHLTSRPHPFSMLSLTNAFSHSDVINHFSGQSNDAEYIIEPKYDGVSLELTYDGGVLKEALTRGTGKIGEVVTPNALMIHGIPKKIPMTDKHVVRGEVVMSFPVFEELNKLRVKANKKPFVNTRNAASGSLRQKDPRETKARKLLFIPYLVKKINGNKVEQAATKQSLLLANSEFVFHGIRRSLSRKVVGLKNIEKVIDEMEAELKNLNYATDGLVIKLNDLKFHKEHEVSSDPTWAIAYKFPEDEVDATVKDLVYQVGRTGQVTPVLELEPIFCGGVIVSRATLHNFTQLKALHPVVGGKVKIKRAGEVIPYVIESLTKTEGELTPISSCPACGGALTSKGELTYCTNTKACPEQLQAKFEHFVKRECFDIDGLGSETLEQLLSKGFVKSPSDLFHLMKSQLLSLDLFGEKKAAKILDSIKEARDGIELSKLIYALGIMEIGESTAEKLVHHFKGDLSAIRKATRFELKEVEDIGNVVSEHIFTWFNTESVKLLDDLLEVVTYVYTPKVNTGELDGKTVCITGGFAVPRSQIKKQLQSMGAKVTSSVSANTHYILVGGAAGDKAKKAEKLGITKLDPAKFNLNV